MGKITHINEGPQLQKQPVIRKGEGQAFQKALDAALENNKIASTPANDTGGPLNALGEIAPTTLYPINPPEHTIFERTHFLLDKLENYSKDLENPVKTLRDIEPLISLINDEAAKLVEDVKGSMENGEPLKEIINQTAIKAASEYIKFNRGDYIA